MKVLVLEDELTHQIRMESTLATISEEMGFAIKVTTTGKISEFKEYVENEEVNQLYFLDIDIKGEETKGLEIARFIRQHNPYAIIVFVTTKSEFATLTFKYKVSALDFIDKNLGDDAFKEHIQSAIEYTKSTLLENQDMVDYFEYSYRGGEVRIPYQDILYIETTGASHKLRIVGKNFFKEFYGTISDIQEKDEKSNRFFSCHKSYLANIGNIQGYDKKSKEIIFYENHRCPITRMKVGKLKTLLEEK
ncbi:competence system response regulator transcription factor ComE [Streptococcus himalayensis]|uniref:DNA-binding response regulator n=1 Tax=Streptococcus himalayensis TaxID=1888195 RepID=A0A917A2Q4_9STRE|nr:competence system response regulator transcription factor ComE [Streptococcus himalayensis]GGE23969.1 DNA-binding response regulator [Streptococcus himalayensis]